MKQSKGKFGPRKREMRSVTVPNPNGTVRSEQRVAPLNAEQNYICWYVFYVYLCIQKAAVF